MLGGPSGGSRLGFRDAVAVESTTACTRAPGRLGTLRLPHPQGEDREGMTDVCGSARRGIGAGSSWEVVPGARRGDASMTALWGLSRRVARAKSGAGWGASG